MQEKITKILAFQIRNDLTFDQLCDEIGITRRTFHNLRIGENARQSTVNLVDNFIISNNL